VSSSAVYARTQDVAQCVGDWFGSRPVGDDRRKCILVLQLRILAAAVVRVGGTSLMLPSPSRPSENEAKPGDWMEEQTCEQSADLRNAEYAGCDQAQAARATGLLSFALLAATCRS
jgi:hypothetical protein